MDDILRQDLTVSVNVGIGATDPVKKIERLLLGIRTMTEINPDIVATIAQQEVAKEVFGALGYKDANRFMLEEQAPMVQEMAGRLEQLEQTLQQLTDQGAGKQIDAQARLMAAQIKGQSDIQAAKEKAMGEVMSTQIRADSTERMDAMRRQLSLIDTRIKAEKNQIARGELLLQKEALVHQMMLAEPEIGIDDEGKMMSEVLMNNRYGMVPGAEN